jgi:hypothetical protein
MQREDAVDEAEMRAGIRDALRSLDAAAEEAIGNELAKSFDLGHSGRLQFEICPDFLRIHLVQTEDDVVPHSVIPGAVPQSLWKRAEAADLDLHTALSEEVLPWFADRWRAAGGPRRFRPAYAYFHGGLDEPRYDLEQRRWCEVSEVWPGEA